MQTKIAHAINIILVFFMTVLLSFQVESPLDERRIITAYFSQVYRMQRIVSKCFPSLRASENGSSERHATLRMDYPKDRSLSGESEKSFPFSQAVMYSGDFHGTADGKVSRALPFCCGWNTIVLSYRKQPVHSGKLSFRTTFRPSGCLQAQNLPPIPARASYKRIHERRLHVLLAHPRPLF